MRARLFISCLVMLSMPLVASASMEDDPLLAMIHFEQLEWREQSPENALVWDGDAWLGRDIDKLWIKSEGEYSDGDTEELELQVLYNRAIATYWDFQAGWRGDIEPGPGRNWLAVGVQGLAPYFFEVDAALFLSSSGRTAARLEAAYDILFTQRLILTPDFEVNFFGKDDERTGTGSGLSDVEIGARLRYEIRREIAPYIGLNWWKKFGDTRDFARAAGEDSDDLQLVVGLRVWF